MPWNSSTKKIVGSANINAGGDIQQATGQSYHDIGNCIKYGCQSGHVNKWSLIKPIHYPGKHKLTLENFRGTTAMINEGIVYGLRVPTNLSNPSPADIHATSWEYVGYPNAAAMVSSYGSCPYRYFDFIHPDTTLSAQNLVGYSENARADISGDIPSTSIFYIDTTMEESRGVSIVSAAYNSSNTEGVKIAEFVVRTSTDEVISPSTLQTRLGKCYPGILIGNYVTALSHGTTGTSIPLRYNNAWTADNWFIDMSRVIGKTTPEGGTAGNVPWNTPSSQTASLVLIYPASNSTYLIAGDSTTDFTRYWTYLDSSYVWNATFFPIPGGTGETISLVKHQTATIANIVSIERVGTIGFRVRYGFTNDYTGNLSVTITANITSSGNVPQAKTVTYTSVSGTTLYNVAFNWIDDYDIIATSGDTYTIEATIATTINGITTYGTSRTETITV